MNTTSHYNFCSLDDKYSNKNKSLFHIIPIPYEATTTYRPGIRFGPQAIIDASMNMELYDEELKQETCNFGIHTLPFIESRASGPKKMVDQITIRTSKLIKEDKVLVSIGGEHTISIGLTKAFHKKHPELSVLILDAHADLRNSYQESLYSHACTARRIQEFAPIIPVGTRSLSAEEAKFIEAKKVNVFWGKEALKNVNAVKELLTDTVYISLDVDIMDPSILPATGTPEPDGWLWHELTGFLKEIILSKNVVGMDIVELSPIKDNPAPDFSIAKLIYRLMGYISISKSKVKV